MEEIRCTQCGAYLADELRSKVRPNLCKNCCPEYKDNNHEYSSSLEDYQRGDI